jgi:endonuclease/exonuclease/phosphatase family metal-dependent hydrolase
MTDLRVVTYNIHKGVQGLGPVRRLEIHNLGHAVEQLDADIVCLQEVRAHNHREARFFAHWPDQPQAEFLAPQGYAAVYRSNAITRHGEHGNAMLTRWPVLSHQHEDMSDHRLEQRGLLHSVVQVQEGRAVHVIVVHLGLIRASRARQLAQLVRFVQREVPAHCPLVVAGDFNDTAAWVQDQLAPVGLRVASQAHVPTFPARWPLVQLDHVLVRGLQLTGCMVPRGRIWARMSDHLPLVIDLAWSGTAP